MSSIVSTKHRDFKIKYDSENPVLKFLTSFNNMLLKSIIAAYGNSKISNVIFSVWTRTFHQILFYVFVVWPIRTIIYICFEVGTIFNTPHSFGSPCNIGEASKRISICYSTINVQPLGWNRYVVLIHSLGGHILFRSLWKIWRSQRKPHQC